MKDLNEKKYWIWLSLIPNLGVKRKQKLLEIYKDPKIIYNLEEKELLGVQGIGETIAKNIINERIKSVVGKHIEYMLKNNIDIITIKDEEYPELLKKIYDPPISLYCKGNKNILNNKSIGIVGCRDATDYGKSCAKYFSYNLANKGINIVSGLARGIDSYAHIGNICAKLEKNSNICGKTIAVLGNGLNIVYPKENEYLERKIIESGGAIISEYPLRY